MSIIDVIDHERECGERKPGGMYLIGGNSVATCLKLPIPLDKCPHCGQGIKQSRGFTWITNAVFQDADCNNPFDICQHCPASPVNYDENKRIGLMWIGEKFYKTTEIFNLEANQFGISKRIAQIPRELKIGQTWIALAHPKAYYVRDSELPFLPGIFSFFRPTRIEYITKGTETPEQLEQLEKRGLTLVHITDTIKKQSSLFNEQTAQPAVSTI